MPLEDILKLNLPNSYNSEPDHSLGDIKYLHLNFLSAMRFAQILNNQSGKLDEGGVISITIYTLPHQSPREIIVQHILCIIILRRDKKVINYT